MSSRSCGERTGIHCSPARPLAVSARQDDRKLKVSRTDADDGKLKPAPLSEPDDSEDADEDPE